jgi:hypothetical protein
VSIINFHSRFNYTLTVPSPSDKDPTTLLKMIFDGICFVEVLFVQRYGVREYSFVFLNRLQNVPDLMHY